MEKESITTIMYKGIEVPAKMVNFGTGISKLMPISTNRYVLHGIPKPNNLNIDAKTAAAARNIVRENKKPGNSEKMILAKYVRKKIVNSAFLIRKNPEIDMPDSIGSKGMPVGIVVAFIHGDRLLIGWSKYLEGKTFRYGKLGPKEPLIFTKKDAMLLAIERGLVDTITFHGSIAYTKGERIIPRNIVNGLDQFIQRCMRYFKRDAFNVIINGEG